MSQKTGLVQVATQGMVQTLTPQQMLVVRLTEMPITDLEQRVKDEIIDNTALEEGKESDDDINNADANVSEYDEGGGETETQIQLGDYNNEDDVPDYITNNIERSTIEELPIGDTTTFLDTLEEQMADYELTEHQKDLVYYLIGSLNDDGFLDQSIYRMVDELLFNHNIETSEEELEEALHILQQFDPAGIGARNSQESFTIQIDRLLADENISEDRAEILRLERRIITDEYENFKNRNYDRLAQNLSVDKSQIKFVVEDMAKHLNPQPGLALCESSSDRIRTATPDFLVETDGEGGISFCLNRGEVPQLHISQQFLELAQSYQRNGEKMSRRDKDSLVYFKQKIDSAQGFIDAINQRNNTLTLTMRAIIALQKEFFLTKDEEDLNKLIYKDVAKMANIDISTVSRVCKSKYALVDGAMYPLSFFFKRSRKNAEGEDVDSSNVEKAIQEIIDSEDKHAPYTDEQIVEKLKDFGINIKRRTVNKYRDSLAIPTATKRKA